MEQPVPRVHRVRRHLRAGPDDPRRRSADHQLVRQRRRAPELPSTSSPWPGPPIAITDRVDTIGDNAHIFQNPEVLALRKAGLVGKPVFNNSHGFEYDPPSRDPERWIGQLPDGSWVVALFNRGDGPGTRYQVDRLRRRPRLHRSGRGPRPVGPSGPGIDDQLPGEPARPMPRSCCRSTPRGPAQYQAEVGAWAGSARFENTFDGHSGMGYVTGLDTEGSSVAVAISAPRAGSRRLRCRVANSTGSPSSTDRRAHSIRRPATSTGRPRSRCRAPRHGLVADRAGHARPWPPARTSWCSWSRPVDRVASTSTPWRCTDTHVPTVRNPPGSELGVDTNLESL